MTSKQEEFETTCQLFVAAIHKYFNHLQPLTEQKLVKPVTGIPYIKDKDTVVLKEFTGMIGISGNRKGFVYISGDKMLYKNLIKIFVRRDDPTDDHLLDMAGEVCNVVSGNVRETFGNNFMITTPLVFQGKPENIKFPGEVPVFVVPVSWNGHEADVVIGLE